jgi:hypothetical protein
MGDACSLLLFRRSVISLFHVRFMVMFNYDYLVVENDVNKILIELPCMLSIGFYSIPVNQFNLANIQV